MKIHPPAPRLNERIVLIAEDCSRIVAAQYDPLRPGAVGSYMVIPDDEALRSLTKYIVSWAMKLKRK